MGRKVLQGLAHNMCQTFLGYQVWDDLPALQRLSSGTLSIELISGHCTKDEQAIEPLAIVHKLRAWLREQLAENGLQLSDLDTAVLAVDYSVREDASHWWERDRYRTWRFHFQCRSMIRAFGREYASADEGEYQMA